MSIVQFNWARNWKKVEPYLNDKDVLKNLEFGMKNYYKKWKYENGPHAIGRGSLNGQRVVKGKLSWYQPRGRCHWIAPFSFAIGKKLYPELKWGYLTSDSHTIAVGLKEGEIKIVMDILLFKQITATQSIAQVKEADHKICFRTKDVFVQN